MRSSPVLPGTRLSENVCNGWVVGAKPSTQNHKSTRRPCWHFLKNAEGLGWGGVGWWERHRSSIDRLESKQRRDTEKRLWAQVKADGPPTTRTGYDLLFPCRQISKLHRTYSGCVSQPGRLRVELVSNLCRGYVEIESKLCQCCVDMCQTCIELLSTSVEQCRKCIGVVSKSAR